MPLVIAVLPTAGFDKASQTGQEPTAFVAACENYTSPLAQLASGIFGDRQAHSADRVQSNKWDIDIEKSRGAAVEFSVLGALKAMSVARHLRKAGRNARVMWSKPDAQGSAKP